MTLSSLARLDRLQRKTERRRKNRNVLAYRKRLRAAGFRRVEFWLTAGDIEALCMQTRPGESLSATLSRVLTGNQEATEESS